MPVVVSTDQFTQEYMSVLNLDAENSTEVVMEDGREEMSKAEVFGFFCFGVINNTSYVIMIAGAKEIDASMVGLIYLCSEIPSLLVKLSGPYWFHKVSYRVRVIVSSFLMAIMFLTVALGSIYGNVWMQLVGVCIGSAQSGVGESSFLALASFYNPSRRALTAWSSGTGMAGLLGYAWVVFFTQGLNFSFSATLFVALCILPAAYLGVFELLLGSPNPEKFASVSAPTASTNTISTLNTYGSAFSNSNGVDLNVTYRVSDHSGLEKGKGDDFSVQSPMFNAGTGTETARASTNASTAISSSNENKLLAQSSARGSKEESSPRAISVDAAEATAMVRGNMSLTLSERLHATARLWPYMVPLAVVYAAEYTMQAGVWSAMGFPVTDVDARKKFYEYANWCYQAGVVISRSSGTFWTPTRLNLWIMPILQVCFLIFSIINAYQQLWYNWSILFMCFCVGLLGGAVYVGGFSLIAMESPVALREFNLGAASAANSAGVAIADICSIFLQKAIYSNYGLHD